MVTQAMLELIPVDKIKPNPWNLRLAWFGGIIDGEGSIGLCKTHKGKTKTGYIIVPQIQVSNRNKVLIDEVSSILKELGVKSAYCIHRRFENLKWSDEYQIHISKHADIIKLLETIRPFIISKTQQAETVLEFCKNRLGKHRVHVKGKFGQFVKTYDGSELVLYEKLIPLNKKGTRKT